MSAEIKKKKKKESRFLSTLSRLKKNKMAMAGLIIVCLILLMALFAPLIAPYGYEEQDLAHMFSSPSSDHWMGTDNLGRDIFSRLVYGSRQSLKIGFLSVLMASVIGITLGAIAGYYGGKVDNILMRFLDVFQSVPAMLMSIAIAATLGAGMNNAIVAIGIGTVPIYARMTRAQFLSIRGMEYVEAAVAINAKDPRIIAKHILPNALSPMIVQMTMGVAGAILTAASLSFIGLGAQPPLSEWGAMLSAGRSYIRDYPHLVMFPGITIMITVLSLNMLGDGLRDALDPRLKN
ncbi:ABC transporter permease [Cuneatibacter sp. NSJ-177]|uniref:ABC transporter permease n=1 Tax=Cuneatibacter sp. NSJ-177 TaxID=2931401 RepID=UPI001FD18AFD|nr:ABC transporter permease [Cuneatibacter sp. NSJ-177]MCJ7834308.1 ABC transporter permease [Cuneatibacter sp. NSJ-177]